MNKAVDSTGRGEMQLHSISEADSSLLKPLAKVKAAQPPPSDGDAVAPEP